MRHTSSYILYYYLFYFFFIFWFFGKLLMKMNFFSSVFFSWAEILTSTQKCGDSDFCPRCSNGVTRLHHIVNVEVLTRRPKGMESLMRQVIRIPALHPIQCRRSCPRKGAILFTLSKLWEKLSDGHPVSVHHNILLHVKKVKIMSPWSVRL